MLGFVLVDWCTSKYSLAANVCNPFLRFSGEGGAAGEGEGPTTGNGLWRAAVLDEEQRLCCCPFWVELGLRKNTFQGWVDCVDGISISNASLFFVEDYKWESNDVIHYLEYS